MARNLYQEQEEDMEDRNEAFGRDFVASRTQQNQQPILKMPYVAKIYVHKSGQLSFFEELKPQQKIGTNRGVEYIKLTKGGRSVRNYVEEYVPELDD